jgi:hypothetical protein
MNEQLRQYLINRARRRTNQVVTYQQLSDDCGLKLNMRDNPNDRKIIGDILDEISVYEADHGRPLLSALVIRSSDNYEGDGFYKMAERLGFGSWQRLKKEGIFEAQQIKLCIEFWSDEAKFIKNR